MTSLSIILMMLTAIVSKEVAAFGTGASSRSCFATFSLPVPSYAQVSSSTLKATSFDSSTSTDSATDFIFSQIVTNDVVVFSATYCPHCVQTKQLLERMGINAKIISLDTCSNGLGPSKDSIAFKLLELTGQRTVPNVFVLGKHLGGNEQVHEAARSGALKQMLSNVAAP